MRVSVFGFPAARSARTLCLALLFALSALTTVAGLARAQGPYSFGGYAWGASIEDIEGLSFKSSMPPFSFFTRPDDPFMRETPAATEVIYMFLNGKLAGASVWFGNEEDYRIWAERLSKLYGPSIPTSATVGKASQWGQGDVTITGSYVSEMGAGVFNYSSLSMVREILGGASAGSKDGGAKP